MDEPTYELTQIRDRFRCAECGHWKPVGERSGYILDRGANVRRPTCKPCMRQERGAERL